MKSPLKISNRVPFPARSDLKDKKPIPPSEIPKLYSRNDLPIKLDNNQTKPAIKWEVPPEKLDIKYYLP